MLFFHLRRRGGVDTLWRRRHSGPDVNSLQTDGKRDDIAVVEGSGRRLSDASHLGREISLRRDTARILKQPREIDKERIWLVPGSGRSFGEESPIKATAEEVEDE